MKIAQIAPFAESVPPKLYGGTERIVSYLTEELVAQGHEVTLFASGDSVTDAKLVPCSDLALRLNLAVKDHLPHQVVMLEEVRRRAHEFDVLHFHIDLLHFPLIRDFADRTLTTLHGRLDLPDLKPFYKAFADIPLVSISNERRPMPPVNWAGTVYHGLPADLLAFTKKPKGNYLAFLGRPCPSADADLRPSRLRRCRPMQMPRRVQPTKDDNRDSATYYKRFEPCKLPKGSGIVTRLFRGNDVDPSRRG